MIYYAYPNHTVIKPTHNVFDFFANLWEIADEIGPVVKLSIPCLLGILLLLFKKSIFENRLKIFLFSGLFSIISISMILFFLPKDLSRGFGFGLSDLNIFNVVVLLYNLAALIGGLFFATCYHKLIKNH